VWLHLVPPRGLNATPMAEIKRALKKCDNHPAH
jgi:hypothetical protein